MPWGEFPPASPAANPTGIYERSVDIPAEWAGRRIVLQVGAAESVLLVHVNGRPVGISKDSHLAAEFDLSDVVRPGDPATVRFTVVKWSDASHIEDQDQWWHAGITRSVLLYATDPLHLADVTVRAAAGRAAAGRLPGARRRGAAAAGVVRHRGTGGPTPRPGRRVRPFQRRGHAGVRLPRRGPAAGHRRERAAVDRRDARAVRPDRAPAPRRRLGRRHLAPPGRVPGRRDPRPGPAGQRRARLHPGREPARLPPADRAHGHRRTTCARTWSS